ncbi:MAG: hypothetical protein WBZ36_27390 [Candidatus Nitrosopolaris sp.]|jgi:hypothetical protein
MIKQISLITLVLIGMGTLFLGTMLASAFATESAGRTGNPGTGNPHQPPFKGPILITCIVGKGCIEKSV